MTHPLPSRHHQYRVQNIARRLVALLESLDLPVAQRRRPLPAAVAGPARRTLGEAEALLGGGLLPPRGTREPAHLFASALLNLKLVSRYNHLLDNANSRQQ